MNNTAVLIDLFFCDRQFSERIKLISECGYSYIETWRGSDANELKEMYSIGKSVHVDLISIVMNFAVENEVAPISRENKQRFLEQIDRYSDNALAAGCKQGIVTAGQSIPGRNYSEQRAALVDVLCLAGEKSAAKGFSLNLEALNTEIDHPGYFLSNPFECAAIVKEIAMKNVKMLYDIYHMGIMTGNLLAFIEQNINWIGHFHAAGIPGRHEPCESEINLPYICRTLERLNYRGYLGLEYFPSLESGLSLRQTRTLLEGR